MNVNYKLKMQENNKYKLQLLSFDLPEHGERRNLRKALTNFIDKNPI